MDVHPTCFVRKHESVLSKTLPWCGDERRCGAVAHPFPMSSSKHRQNSFSNHRGSGRMESVRERQQGLDIKHLHGVQGFWLCIRNHEKQTTTSCMARHYNHTFYHLSLIISCGAVLVLVFSRCQMDIRYETTLPLVPTFVLSELSKKESHY